MTRGTEQAYTMLHFLDESAHSSPSNIAYSFLHDDSVCNLTYLELQREAMQVAYYLSRHASVGDRVLILMESSLEYVTAFWGCLYAGMIAVPLYQPKKNDKHQRLDNVIDDCEPALAFLHADKYESLRFLLPEKLSCVAYHLESFKTVGKVQLKHFEKETVAYLQYSSGSTGKPKGVMISHGNIMANVEGWHDCFGHVNNVWVNWIPLFHDLGLISIVMMPVFQGDRSIFFPPIKFIKRPWLWIEAISTFKGTVSCAPNFAYDYSAAKLNDNDELLALDLSSWRVAINGGEPVKKTTLDKFLKVFEPSGFKKTTLAPAYGMAEATVFLTASNFKLGFNALNISNEKLQQGIVDTCVDNIKASSYVVGCGIPIAGHDIIIVDKSTLLKLEEDRVGEVWARCDSIAKGYWQRDDLNKEVFNAYAASGEGPYFRTGDLGFLHDKELFISGRLKDLIIVNGKNIYPNDIEIVSSRFVDDNKINYAAAFGVSKDVQEELVIAQEIKKLPDDLAYESLIKKIKKDIFLAFDVTVKELVFVAKGSLAKTTSGKIKHSQIKEDYLNDRLKVLYRSSKNTHSGVLSIIQDVLMIDEVNEDDNFFDLGGNSLLVMQLMNEVLHHLGRALSIRDVFDNPTVGDLVQLLECAQKTVVNPIKCVSRHQLLPLSWAQQRLWLVAQLEGASAAYHIPFAVRLHGALSVSVLNATFDTIVARHESLRTTFKNSDGQPYQCIQEHTGFTLHSVDLSDLPEEQQVNEITKQITKESETSFDLTTGPLVRGRLLSLSNKNYILLITFHHIVADGWSMAVLVDEINTLYEAYSQGEKNPLSPLVIQYADFAVWQRDYFVDEVLTEQEVYWANHLANAPSLLNLPTDYPRPSVQSYRGSCVNILFDVELSHQIKILAKQEGLTLHMVMVAALTVLLARLSGDDQVVVGTPVANRQRHEVKGLIGFFVNTLALNFDVNSDLTVRDFLAHVKKTSLSGYVHQDVSFERIVERVQPTRSSSHSPVFQVLFNFDYESTVDNLELPGVTVSNIQTEYSSTKFDLTLSLVEIEGCIRGSLEYATDLFLQHTVERWSGYFKRIIESFLSTPDAPISALDMLSVSERGTLLSAYNQTQLDYPRDRLIQEQFEAQVKANPNNTAVVYEDVRLSYSELNTHANQLAHYLIEHGVKGDTLVGLCMNRSPEMMIGLLGILKAGGAYVPLDSNLPQQRLAYQLEDTGVAIVITDKEVASSGLIPAPLCLNLDDHTTQNNLAQYSIDNPEYQRRGLHATNLAYVIYTSGSTGQPKGVQVTHQGVVNYLTYTAEQYFTHSAGAVVNTRLSFDATVTSVLGPLMCGQYTYLISTADSDVELNQLRQLLMTSTEPLVFKMTPAHLQALHAGLSNDQTIGELTHVFVIGGEQLIASVLSPWLNTHLPNAVFVNEYGPTETVVGCSTYWVNSASLSTIDHAVPIGQPVMNSQLYVVDNRQNLVPEGVVGELLIGGDGVARGYLGRPELTAEKFIANPFVGEISDDNASRLYRTGDLVRYRNDGELEFVGRVDDQIKLRGFRIELGEIEAQLMVQPSIDEAVVLLKQTEAIDDGQLVAYVVLSTQDSFSSDNLLANLAEQLPEYMIPSVVITLEHLPLTANGKVDHKALLLLSENLSAGELPVGAAEKKLAELWQDLLGVEQVSREDNFYQLGGHSLLAIRLINEIEQCFGQQLTIRSVFESPVLKDLARELNVIDDHVVTPIQRADRSQLLPLSWGQQRLWFIAQLEGGNAAYHTPSAVRLQGALSISVLNKTFDTIIERHESLRTVFKEENGEPYQSIQTHSTFALRQVDLSELAEAEQAEGISDQVSSEQKTTFDLSQGPLLRGRLLRLSDDAHILLVTMHHIVSDAWSMGVLINEINTVYAAYLQGAQNPLAPLAIQYADYAVWQREHFIGDVLAEQEVYWMDHLADIPSLLSLPTDYPRPSVQSYRGDSVDIIFDSELSEQIYALTKREGISTHMLLLSAWGFLLSRLSGEDHVVIGTPVANRQRQEMQNLIGFFVNTLALRLDVNGDLTIKDFLTQVKETSLSGYAHQDIPFEQVVEALQPERSLSHSPVFQVLFNFETIELDSDLQLAGVRLDGVVHSDTIAKFDLSLSLSDSDEGIQGVMEYATDLFSRETITRWLGYFKSVVEGLLLDSAQPLHEISLLSAPEQKNLLNGLNQTYVDYPSESLIQEHFETQVKANPNNIAAVYEGVALSYSELNTRANQLAHYLIEQGVKGDTLVGLCVEPSLDMVIGLLGILKSGGAYVPLNPNLPQVRLNYQISDTGISIIVTQAHVATSGHIPNTLALSLDDGPIQDQLAQYSTDNPNYKHLGINASNLAYVIYTSGSTGQPKGVLIEHRSVVNLLQWYAKAYEIESKDKVVIISSLSFDLTQKNLLTPLTVGAEICFANYNKYDPSIILDQIENSLPTLINCAPASFYSLVSVATEQNTLDKLNSLSRVLLGGEPIHMAKLSSWFQHTSGYLVNMYGPTECTDIASAYRIPSDLKSFDSVDSVPIGNPNGNVKHYVVDASLNLVPQGVTGELLIGGVGLAREYLNSPTLTAEKFIQNPFSENSNDRLYKTGDLVRYLADGNLEFIGRVDHQIKLRGFRVELGEIEHALASHEAVNDTVILATPASNGDQRLVAYVATDAVDVVSDSEVSLAARHDFIEASRNHLRNCLPDYMVPSVFVLLDTLPLTSNGKVDRKALPKPNALQSQATYIAPRTTTESVLCDLWKELLDVERVGVTDNFFHLGGHSLLVLQLITKIDSIFQIKLPIRIMFEQNTIAQLGTVLSKNTPDLESKAIKKRHKTDVEKTKLQEIEL